jgi:DNA (cytosine-5)-methyltransferase 1
MTIAYYNEYDKNAAAWLRELIKQGLIADGVVDERSIIDVQANELVGFSQYHFFAGIGGWSYALRLAGWADTRPVWTASLPCQPFSVAGNQKGKDDARHLLPHFLELVKECRPNTIIGEQVEGAIKHGWLDDLQSTMEAEDYAVGSIVLGAHSGGAPHIRQRLYWIANRVEKTLGNTAGAELERGARQGVQGCGDGLASSGYHVGTTDTLNTRPQGRLSGRKDSQREAIYRYIRRDGAVNGLGNSNSNGHTSSEKQGRNEPSVLSNKKRKNSTSESERTGPSKALSPNWSDVEWIYCRDNKYRPILRWLKPVIRTIKSSVSTVANGLPAGVVHSGDNSTPINANETQEARIMRLVGYGNAIVPQVAAEFIKAFMGV